MTGTVQRAAAPRTGIAVQLVLQGVLDLALEVGGDVVPVGRPLAPAAADRESARYRWDVHLFKAAAHLLHLECAAPSPVRNVSNARQRYALREGLAEGWQLAGAATRQQSWQALDTHILPDDPFHGPVLAAATQADVQGPRQWTCSREQEHGCTLDICVPGCPSRSAHHSTAVTLHACQHTSPPPPLLLPPGMPRPSRHLKMTRAVLA